MANLRAGLILAAFLIFTLPLMLLQWLLLRLWPDAARRLPCWYHRRVCRLLGLKLRVEGVVEPGPLLLVANHASWLDIPVLSAIAPLAFIAKREVSNWPFIGTLARLQRTVFVDREARLGARAQSDAIVQRLAAGGAIVLFAEGTSNDGNRVLPFKSSLFAAAFGSGNEATGALTVQTVTIAYTRLHGLPLGRGLRPCVAWYGDMDVPRHAWALLGLGPIDVAVRISPPLPATGLSDRKTLAATTHAMIAADLRALLRPQRR